MPTLKHYGGPARPRRDCGCDVPGLLPGTSGPSLLPPASGDCGPGPGEPQLPGNAPVDVDEYQCSVAIGIQTAVDEARRVNHELGLRPYRVFLVWQQRDRQRVWSEVTRLELLPVRIVSLDDIDLELAASGLQSAGRLMLRDVSPAQVNGDDLRGRLNDEAWGQDTIDREFFYEVRIFPRCPTSPEPRRRRFIIATEPHHSGDNYEWRVGLVDQEIARSRTGADRSIEPKPAFERPRIVP